MLGLGLGINKIIGFGAMKPCPTGLTYWSDVFSADGLMLNDKSGLGNHAKLTQSNCLTFDGTDDYLVSTNKITWFDDARNPWTYEQSGIFTAISTNSGLIANRDGVGGFVILRANTGNLPLYVRMYKVSDTNDLTLFWNNVLPNGVVKKVRITYDGSMTAAGIKLYIDDVLSTVTPSITQTLTDWDITAPTTQTAIGSTFTTGTQVYKGSMWGVKAWKSVQEPNSGVIPDLLDLPMACGGGDLNCDRSISQNHFKLTNFNLATCWTKQDSLHENLLNGFSQMFRHTGGVSAGYIITNKAYSEFGGDDFNIRCRFITPIGMAGTVLIFGNNMVGTSTVGITAGMFFWINGSTLRCQIVQNSVNIVNISNALQANTCYDLYIGINRTNNTTIIKLVGIDGFVIRNEQMSSIFTGAFDIPANLDLLRSTNTVNLISISTGRELLGLVDDIIETQSVSKLQLLPNSPVLVDTITGDTYTTTAVMTYTEIPTRNYEVNKDVTGNEVMYPAGKDYHNGAETLLDFTNGGANIDIRYSSANWWTRAATTGDLSVITTHYGVKEFVYKTQPDTFIIGISALTTTVTADSYAIVISNNTIILRKYVASAATTLITGPNLSTLPSNTQLGIKVERNQTENQYFTGVANTFRMSLKGHTETYPVDGDDWEVVGTVLDTAFTTGIAYFVWSTAPANSALRNLKINGSNYPLTSMTYTAGVWKETLAQFAFNDILDNPAFYRKSLRDDYSIRNDRFLIYDKIQVAGSCFSKTEKWLDTVVLDTEFVLDETYNEITDEGDIKIIVD